MTGFQLRTRHYALTVWLAFSMVTVADTTTQKLAQQLSNDGLHEAAAVEYRRLALESARLDDSSSFYWAAAYAYWRIGDSHLASGMLDRAEDLSRALELQSRLLRAEIMILDKRWTEAEYHLQSLADHHPDQALHGSIVRRLASVQIQLGDMDAATARLQSLPSDTGNGLTALENYRQGRDKSPRTGGLLGLVPGLGYAYSGEYGNALRSLILNSLFIFGMADTAKEDQWGGFAIITFFELTWYTGSIYGGFDAAHRYNQDRLLAVAEQIDGDLELRMDFSKIPVITLQY